MHYEDVYPIDPIIAQAIVACFGLENLNKILREARDLKDFIENYQKNQVKNKEDI